MSLDLYQSDLRDELVTALTELEYEPKPYSGRGMMGKQCVSVSGVSQWDLALKLGHLDITIEAPREDNMGFSNVLYWPSMNWGG